MRVAKSLDSSLGSLTLRSFCMAASSVVSTTVASFATTALPILIFGYDLIVPAAFVTSLGPCKLLNNVLYVQPIHGHNQLTFATLSKEA